MAIFSDVYGGYSVDDLLPGVLDQESKGRRYAVSTKGAIGLYQIMPKTAEMYGYSREDMFDPVKNEDVARQYLGMLLEKYRGNAFLALAAYNAGPGNVDHGILPTETSKYVDNVLNFTRSFSSGAEKRTLANVTGRDISPRMDKSGPIDPSFRGTPVNQIFNRYGRITGEEPGYGGEGTLQKIPPRPMATMEQGLQKVGPALGSLFSPIGSAISSVGKGISSAFNRPPVTQVLPDPGETVS